MLALGCVGQVSPPEGASAVDARVVEAAVVDARTDSPAADALPLGDAAISDVPVTPPGPPDPGRVTLHRLNRVEYNNTVRDLFGTTRTPADDFPADDRGYGFDNIADVLTMSPVQLELYQGAAETLVNEALRNPVVPSVRRQFEAESLTGSVGAATGTAWNLWSNGELPARLTPTAPGRFRITVRAWQSRGGPDDAHMNILVDGRAVMGFAVPNLAASPGEFSADVTLASTTSVTVAAEFTNDFYDPAAMQDRNLYVDWIRVEGPIDAVGRPTPRARASSRATRPPPRARPRARGRGDRGLRAPRVATPVDRRRGDRASRPSSTSRARRARASKRASRLALQAVLLSPHFVFRVELDADPTSTVAHPLNDHELAARLSYFLWSSMPDDALFALADAGRLREPATLRAQVERMLADPKARALTDNFAGQWLYTRSLAEHDADPGRFPAYTPALRASFRAETEAYFDALPPRRHRDGASFSRRTSPSSTTALARFYGITAPAGTGLRRVALTGDRRGGLLTQASLLTVNSHADRTSPVRRGQWVLNQLMCEPPPPPPPDVMGLPPETIPTGSLRQRFEAHRAEPRCATCHALMDPIGFAFEHFDAVGAWRERDEGFAIDTTGTLPGTGAPSTAPPPSRRSSRATRGTRAA